MFDTLCRHYLPPYGNDWVKAPNFTRLAKRTAQFQNCYVGSMPCMPARREMHTGRYNFLHRSWGPLEPFDDSMPEQLRNAGVHSHKVTDHQHYWEDGGATYHTRFSTFEFVRGQEGDPWIGQVEDVNLNNKVAVMHQDEKQQKQDWVNRQHMTSLEKQPQHITFSLGLEFIERNKDQDNWFLQLETFDPHEPFFTQKEFQDLYPHNYNGLPFDWPPYRHVMEDKDMVEHMQCMYASLVSMCDKQLGRVLDIMDRLNMWEDTLLIVNTDHGFLMGEHDWWAKCIQPFYQEIAHVPLWIWDPRSKAQGVQRESLVQTIDIPATILDFFELPLPTHMRGKPLGSTIACDQPVREAALFGIHGGHVNVTDGHYTYFRGCEKPDNTPLFEYTLMPLRMRSRFRPDELVDATLVKDQFTFAKGAPVMKVKARRVLITEHDTLLYDIIADPQQLHSMSDNSREITMIQHMLRLMMENESPREQYARLGLPDPNTFRDGNIPFQVLQKAVRIKVNAEPFHPKHVPKGTRVTAITARAAAHKHEPWLVKLTAQFFRRSTKLFSHISVPPELTTCPSIVAQPPLPTFHVEGRWLRDQFGRIVLPRGLNVSGCSKLPIGTATHNSFLESGGISFVGRPFPLEAAPRHFARLREWGFTLIRFLVTWEAVEHEGPGVYDREYLEYVRQMILLAAEHGILVFIDPHQDVWSRFTGGDGAPAWTLELIGFKLAALFESGAALSHQEWLAQPSSPSLPSMIWTTNYHKLACATMFTLFFAGNDFAPKTLIDGVPAQNFLQSHYINAMVEVAKVLVGCPNVVGFDSLNEPSSGWIGVKNLTQIPETFLQGAMPTPLQAMSLGAGIPCEVAVYLNHEKTGSRVLNESKTSAWSGTDVWQAHGVWALEDQKAVLKSPDYFSSVGGKPVDFHRYLTAFAARFVAKIRKVLPHAVLFLEGPPLLHPRWGKDQFKNVVHASHWYDIDALFYKTANVHSWPAQTQADLNAQVKAIKDHSEKQGGGVPTLIGECGLPFDLNAREAFQTRNYAVQKAGLNATIMAMESNMLPFTLWNYNPDNTEAFGDQWNLEDLSVFCPEHPCECEKCSVIPNPDCIHKGGRALHAIVRPYARALCGEPKDSSFCMRQRVFVLTLTIERLFPEPPSSSPTSSQSSPTSSAQARSPTWAMSHVTEIFIPKIQYPNGYHVHVSDGQYYRDTDTQTLFWRPEMELFRPNAVARLSIWPISSLNAAVHSRIAKL